MMASDPQTFKFLLLISSYLSRRLMYHRKLVQESLRRHVDAINKLTARGMRFWDYGNSL